MSKKITRKDRYVVGYETFGCCVYGKKRLTFLGTHEPSWAMPVSLPQAKKQLEALENKFTPRCIYKLVPVRKAVRK